MTTCTRHLCFLSLTAAIAVADPAPATAQNLLEVALSPTVITFPASDPDALPVIASGPVTVSYRVRGNRGPWRLTVLASGDLISGGATVDISNISWVATPAPPFQGGTLSKTVAQTVAAGVDNVTPTATGSITFHLVNSWTYSTGIYTQTIVFTLSAP
jgi:hypothetical protein